MKSLKTILLALLILTACTSGGQTPTPESLVNTSEPGPTPIAGDSTPDSGTTTVPTPTSIREPRTLKICLGAEPDSLYLYETPSRAAQNVLEAIYDGPFDANNYGYQPVILEKIPSLADGDAALQPLTVKEGDLIVDADGNVTSLAAGVTFRPAGCQRLDCAIPFASGEVQMGQLSATFTLLEGLKWSDGEPLSAHDSVYSFQIEADPATRRPQFRIERTASYTALDDRTVQWVGLPGFLDPTYQTNFWSPLPQHAWGNTPISELRDQDFANRSPIGWGPYVIKKWASGRGYLELEKNPYYFRASEGLPKFDILIFEFKGGDINENLGQVAVGLCDGLDNEAISGQGFGIIQQIEDEGYLKSNVVPITTWEHADFGIVPVSYDNGYHLGVDRPDYFGDVRTRRAIAYCMDRAAINQKFFANYSGVPNTYLPPGHPLYNPNVPQYPFDPAAGMVLLDEVGWRDTDGNPSTPRVAQGIANIPEGTPLSFNYLTTPFASRPAIAQILVDSLAQCGVQLTLQAWGWDEVSELFAEGPDGPLFGRQFDMAQLSWLTGAPPPCDLYLTEQIPGEDPARFPYRWGGTNLTGYSNPAFDTACKNALSMLPGQPGYTEAHHLAQQIFAEDLPVIPLYFHLRVLLFRPDLCGQTTDPTADSDFWNLEEFDYGETCQK